MLPSSIHNICFTNSYSSFRTCHGPTGPDPLAQLCLSCCQCSHSSNSTTLRRERRSVGVRGGPRSLRAQRHSDPSTAEGGLSPPWVRGQAVHLPWPVWRYLTHCFCLALPTLGTAVQKACPGCHGNISPWWDVRDERGRVLILGSCQATQRVGDITSTTAAGQMDGSQQKGPL